MAELGNHTFRTIVKEELAASDDIITLKSDVAQLKTEVTSLGVQFEAFDSKLDAIVELIRTTVETRSDVRSLKERVDSIESDIHVLKAAVRHQS